jgi:endo-1,3-1,4-beta-glycanase ExoK
VGGSAGGTIAGTNGDAGGAANAAGGAGRPTGGGSGFGGAGGAGEAAGSGGGSGAGVEPNGGKPTSGGSGGGVLGGAAGVTDGGAGATAMDRFTLLFRDEFESLDLSRWQVMTHSWEGNLALFSAQVVNVEAGLLAVRLQRAPEGTVDDTGATKPYLGAEVRSRDTLTYGRVRARAKFATGPAVVSALVTIYTPWPADDWNELDIECLGKDSSSVQFNAQVYTGPPLTPPVSTSVSPTQYPYLEALGFDASADFHIYTIEWTPEGATFLVDDVPRYTWTENISLMTLPQNVLITIWASSSAAWAGAVTERTEQASAAFDWVELYRYTPP